MKKFFIATLFILLCAVSAQARTTDSASLLTTEVSQSELVFPSYLNPSADFSADPVYYSTSSSSSGSLFVDLLTEIFVELWFLDNFLVNFDDYPYANGEKYLTFDPSMADTMMGTSDANWYRFALDSSIYCYPGLYSGAEVRFEGLIWKFFGPIVEVDFSNIIDFTGDPDPEDEDAPITAGTRDISFQIALEMSVFQSNPLSLFWSIGWSTIKTGGERYSGLVAQLIARSYPVNPILIEWRGTILDMSLSGDSSIEYVVLESHLEVGAMVAGPLEVFAAWRYLSSETLRYRGHGFDVGIRYHL